MLFAVEPLSYFLFYVKEGKAIDLPTPMRLDAPSRVPFGASTRGLARKIAVEPGSSHAQREEMPVVESSSKLIKYIIIKTERVSAKALYTLHNLVQNSAPLTGALEVKNVLANVL